MAASFTSQHEHFAFATMDALAQRIHELHVDTPLTRDVDVLFETVEVAGRRVPSRFAVQPMEDRDGGRVGCAVHDQEIRAKQCEQGRRRAEGPPPDR